MSEPRITSDGCTITVRVPISIRKRGGRKLVLAPGGSEIVNASISRYVDNALVKAIARAFRWRDMLESGAHTTIAEIAEAETINQSYVSRVLRLTLLAPEIIERIAQGRQPTNLSLSMLLAPLPVCWREQKRVVGLTV